MSMLIDAEIVNAIVLAAVLEADLGSHRKITRFRSCGRSCWPQPSSRCSWRRSPPTAPG